MPDLRERLLADNPYCERPLAAKLYVEGVDAALEAGVAEGRRLERERLRALLLSDEAVEAASREFEPSTWERRGARYTDAAMHDARCALAAARAILDAEDGT